MLKCCTNILEYHVQHVSLLQFHIVLTSQTNLKYLDTSPRCCFAKCSQSKDQSTRNNNLSLWQIMAKQLFKINNIFSMRTGDNQQMYWIFRAFKRQQLPCIRVKHHQQQKSEASRSDADTNPFNFSKPNRQSDNHSHTQSCVNLVSHSQQHTIPLTNIYQYVIIHILSHAHTINQQLISEYVINTTTTDRSIFTYTRTRTRCHA